MGTAGWEVPEKLLIDTHSSIYLSFRYLQTITVNS
jgi:hypothetical protein